MRIPLVRIRGLSKRFGGTLALAGVDLDVHRGSVLALLGPNGAGKSTLIKVLAGVHRADEGEVTVAGHPLGTEAASRSMSFIHQDLGLVEWMTVAENIALGTGYPRRGGLISWRRTRERCAEALGSSPATSTPTPAIADLARAERSLVAIARALADPGASSSSSTSRPPACPPRTAPASSTCCTPCATEGTASSTSATGSTRSTRSPTPSPSCATAVSSARARSPATAPPASCTTSSGREPAPTAQPAPAAGGRAVLTLDGVRTASAGPVSLELRAGEILGLVGLTGAGHMDLGRALAGSRPLLGRAGTSRRAAVPPPHGHRGRRRAVSASSPATGRRRAAPPN